MIISREKLDQARAEAKEYLEYSIYTLSMMLGIDPEEINEEWVALTEETLSVSPPTNQEDAAALQCLVEQVKAYSKISPLE